MKSNSDTPLPDSKSLPTRENYASELGRLLQSSRDYLTLIAQRSLDEDLRIKASASDLVQQTFLKAHREYPSFDGDHTAQLRAWLRQILLNNIATAKRHYKASKRDISREKSTCQTTLPSRDKSPSSMAARNEETRLLELALDQLAREHQQVILLRNIQRLSFSQVGSLMDRSDEAARKLWFRAMQKLRLSLRAVRNRSHI